MCMSLMFEVVEKEEEKRRELTDPVWMEWMSILSSLIRSTAVQGEGKGGKEGGREGGREGEKVCKVMRKREGE